MSEYILSRATVIANGSEQDPRTTIRIDLLMDEIKDETVLPKYPSFSGSKILSFVIGTKVWVVSTKDYYIGYIIGKSNIFSETAADYEDFSSRLAAINNMSITIGGGYQTFSDLHFLYVDKNLIEAVNVKTGSRISYHSNGSLFIQSTAGFYMSQGESVIEMANNEIILKADTISLNGRVALGNGNMSNYVLSTTSPGLTFVMNNGSIATSSEDVII